MYLCDTGICHSVWVVGVKLPISRPDVTHTEWQIPVSHGYSNFSWWWAHGCPKHVGKINKYVKQNCAPSWIYLQDCTRMHGQQNIKFPQLPSYIQFKIKLPTYLFTVCTPCGWNFEKCSIAYEILIQHETFESSLKNWQHRSLFIYYGYTANDGTS